MYSISKSGGKYIEKKPAIFFRIYPGYSSTGNNRWALRAAHIPIYCGLLLQNYI
jgi:hypothetical protein